MVEQFLEFTFEKTDIYQYLLFLNDFVTDMFASFYLLCCIFNQGIGKKI